MHRSNLKSFALIPTFVKRVELLAQELDLLDHTPGKHAHLIAPYHSGLGSLYMFRGGAKLNRTGTTRWSISYYAHDKGDLREALLQLRAAHYMRLAVDALNECESALGAHGDNRRQYLGMIARFSNGQLSPYQYHAPEND